MTEVTRGERLRALREARGLTQAELGERAGFTRGYISQIETDLIKDPGMDTFRQLAIALGMSLDEFDTALTGKSTESIDQPDDLLQRFLSVQPVRLPVQTDFAAHAGEPVQPPEYYWIPRGGAAPKGIEAIRVVGDCLTPVIEEGDVIIVDRNAAIDNGNVVACVYRDELHLGRIKKVADGLWLENSHGRIKFEECGVVARVIQIERKLR